MHPSLVPYNDRVKLGLLRSVEKDGLILYNYTDKCTFERAWDEYTIRSRGIIFEKDTGEIIARPFPKFFNLGEMENVTLDNLPDELYSVWEKMDGSLGIVYYYNNKWNVATRGAFTSDQAIKGAELLKKYNTSILTPGTTYLVEIIYPSNKIIVNYENKEELVLLGAIDIHYRDMHPLEVATCFPIAHSYGGTIEDCVKLKKTIPKDKEGWVVRFESGLRIKIKGDEYLKIAKLLSHLSPLSLWECMKSGIVESQYLCQIPEEFRNEWEPIKKSLEHSYQKVISEIQNDLKILPTTELTPEGKKAIGIFLVSKNTGIVHSDAIFPYLLGRHDKYIMNYIRPIGNVLK